MLPMRLETRRNSMQIPRILLGATLLLLASLRPASAATINISTADNYSKIEAAKAGDIVVVAPGTYRFRVYLTGHGTPSQPITIQAQDPAHRPVWDFSATAVENAPGSYPAPDRGRGGWQVSGGSNYRITGIEFTGCSTAALNSAGLRYYAGTTGLYLKDCVFHDNDNGITGGTQHSDATLEFCEFYHNGNTAASSPTHNLYIYAGVFAMRYSYIHDSVQAQNFHIRAQLAVLEYNWFARAASYEGDLMTNDDYSGAGPFTQSMLVRGNVFIQSANPGNHGQVLVAFNDTGLANDAMSLTVINNTYVGNATPGNGAAAAFVHLSNADGSTMSAAVSNNIISGTTNPVQVENSAHGSVQGSNNWLATGVSPGALTASVFSKNPGFNNAAALDYTLATGSPAIGAAAALGAGLAPTREYFGGQSAVRQMRVRSSANDLGAFDRATSGNPIGAYDPPPLPAVSINNSAGNILLRWPLTAADFALVQCANLAPGQIWSDSPGALSIDFSGYALAQALTSGNRFYRLQERP